MMFDEDQRRQPASTPAFGDKVNFLWSIADIIRDSFRRGKYQDVILPFTVLRRLDLVLAPTKPAVLEAYSRYRDRLDNLDPLLRRTAGLAFYNTSPYHFDRLLADAPNLAGNLRAYLAAFSPNIREVIERFDLENTIGKLDEAGLLFLVMERFRRVDLHTDRVDNHTMGRIYEELIRKFNEALNENPGEHFTPREIVGLMVRLLVGHDVDLLRGAGVVREVYDPCCGSGGMLSIAKDYIRALNPAAQVYLFGQESQPETYATSKADFFIKDPTGADADNIRFGSTLKNDAFAGKRFDYLIANPPYGKDWKGDKEAVEAEHERGFAGRYGAGLPRISDGQLLFHLHMLAHMRDAREGGSRIAVVSNGSPLFTADAGSGESKIRRWILENDWLDAIIALPEQIFYNTGIATYVWLLTNRKEPARRSRVLLVDATSFWRPMRRSLGDKRRELGAEHIERITQLYEAYEPGEHCNTTDRMFRPIPSRATKESCRAGAGAMGPFISSAV